MNTLERQNKTIVVPFSSEKCYRALLEDRKSYQSYLLRYFAQHPELFPEGFEEGFSFCGSYSSKKMVLPIRRIRLKSNNETYQVRPSFVMPYMIGKTQRIGQALFLRQWGVPFWALAHLFGKDASFWYRAYSSLGRFHLVGSTVKSSEKLPKHILCDEKHTRFHKQKAYIATTTTKDCILGAALCLGADEASLQKGYSEFAKEAQSLAPSYSPKTATLDGWEATQRALQSLFPHLFIIYCFLHAWFSIKKRCRKDKGLLQTIGKKVWEAYRSKTRGSFSQRIRRMGEWAKEHLPEGSVKEKVLSLCKKRDSFAQSYDYPKTPRTSNGVDRMMDYQDRQLYAMRGIHGNEESFRLLLRASALCWNFHHYVPHSDSTRKQMFFSPPPTPLSPFERMNGFRYHDHWLHNLLIASSLGGQPTLHKKRYS